VGRSAETTPRFERAVSVRAVITSRRRDQNVASTLFLAIGGNPLRRCPIGAARSVMNRWRARPTSLQAHGTENPVVETVAHPGLLAPDDAIKV
jgi:hypothetical protein